MTVNTESVINMDELIKSAEAGDMESQYLLGWHIHHVAKTESDTDDAVKWLRMSAEQGFAKAQCFLGNMLRDYLIHYEKGEDEAAAGWFLLAAQQGMVQAQEELAYMYASGIKYGMGIPQDTEKAVKWNLKAFENGSEVAPLRLGDIYRSGNGITQDIDEAIKWYRIGAEQGGFYCCRNLWEIYESGDGGTITEVEAKQWQQIALDNGVILSDSEYL